MAKEQKIDPKELHILISDKPHDCPYCDKPGGTINYGDSLLHEDCFAKLKEELYSVPTKG